VLNDNIRLILAAGVAIVVQAIFNVPAFDRLAAAWVVGAIVYLILTWWIFLSPRAWDARRWLAAQTTLRSRGLALLFGPQANLVLAIVVSLIGVGSALALLGSSGRTDPNHRLILHALGVVLAWLVLNTAYAHYYVYCFYRGGGTGLIFPTADPPTPDDEPDQLDFAYFAFTLATSFAVSDIQITDRTIRRAALGHSVLAFAYNTAILSVAVGFLTDF
jgi:uncharacterized membrane protein